MGRMEQPVLLPASRFDAAAGLPFPVFRGRVEHAYRLAAYVRPWRGGELVTLAAHEAGGQPNGICVRDVSDFRVATPVGATVHVNLSTAERWSPRLEAVVPSVGRAGLRLAAACAARRAPGGGFGSVLRGQRPADALSIALRDRAARLEDAMTSCRGDVGASAVALLGLGPGLTPSGDDFLVGMLAALEVVGHGDRGAIAVAVADHAPELTTELSARALSHAASGRYPQRLHDVLVAIVTNDAAAIRDRVEDVMRYGATSGADTLAGVFAGLRVAVAHRAVAAA